MPAYRLGNDFTRTERFGLWPRPGMPPQDPSQEARRGRHVRPECGQPHGADAESQPARRQAGSRAPDQQSAASACLQQSAAMQPKPAERQAARQRRPARPAKAAPADCANQDMPKAQGTGVATIELCRTARAMVAKRENAYGFRGVFIAQRPIR